MFVSVCGNQSRKLICSRRSLYSCGSTVSSLQALVFLHTFFAFTSTTKHHTALFPRRCLYGREGLVSNLQRTSVSLLCQLLCFSLHREAQCEFQFWTVVRNVSAVCISQGGMKVHATHLRLLKHWFTAVKLNGSECMVTRNRAVESKRIKKLGNHILPKLKL